MTEALRAAFASVFINAINVLNSVIRKAASRKLLTFVVATHMLYTGHIDSNQWLILAGIFVSAQALVDWKGQDVTTSQTIRE